MKVTAIKETGPSWSAYAKQHDIPLELFWYSTHQESYALFIKDNRLLLKLTKLWDVTLTWSNHDVWKNYL